MVVEDNEDLQVSLCEYLQTEGYNAVGFSNAETAEAALDTEEWAAAIIDINLPGMSGFSFVEAIRAGGYGFPLIALTARDQVADKVRGFELGLTDYVVKPFSLAELTARLRAHVKQTTPTKISTKHILLDGDRREARVDGQIVRLTATEFRMLEVLAQHNGKIVPTDDIIDHAWGQADRWTDPPLRIHMRNLRKKIGDHDLALIKTIPGTGYMLDDVS